MQEASTGWDLRSLFPYGPLFTLVLLFIVLVPVIQVLRRTGHHPAWSLLILVPGMNLLGWWFFAFKRWPIEGKCDPKL